MASVPPYVKTCFPLLLVRDLPQSRLAVTCPDSAAASRQQGYVSGGNESMGRWNMVSSVDSYMHELDYSSGAAEHLISRPANSRGESQKMLRLLCCTHLEPPLASSARLRPLSATSYVLRAPRRTHGSLYTCMMYKMRGEWHDV